MKWQIVWVFKWYFRPNKRRSERKQQISNLIDNVNKLDAIKWLRRDLGIIDWTN